MKRPVLASLFFLLALLIGCGGGGARLNPDNPPASRGFGECPVPTSAGNITYQTTWGNAPANASQVIQIILPDGFPLRTDSLNRSGTNTSTISIENVAAGVHYLRATLYSGPNATGSVLAESNTPLDLCASGPGGASRNVVTTNAVPPTGLEISVPGLTLQTGQNALYIATAKNGGASVFLPLSAIAWTTTGAIGNIANDGQFLATNPGTGAIVANFVAGGITATAPVTVRDRQVTRAKWTVLVFLNAANDLFTFSAGDVNEMEQVAQNPDVRFVVQWKQSKSAFSASSFDGVRRYLVRPDNTSQIASELLQSNLRQPNGSALDMGDPQTLRDFVTWGKANFPADRYVLVVWNHGNGWRRSPLSDGPTRAFSYDDEFGTSIQTWEISQALQGHTVDILAWDCSLMQMLEVAYEARDHATYIVGSQESPPGEGYPYAAVFREFRDNPDATTRALTNAFVLGMLNHPPYASRKITQSSIESARLPALVASLDALAAELITHRLAIANAVTTVRSTAQAYSRTTSRTYLDLVDVCLRLEAEASVPQSVKTAAADVRAKVAEAVVFEASNANSPGSNGIAIDFSSGATFAPSRQDYIRLKLAQDSRWDEWLALAP